MKCEKQYKIAEEVHKGKENIELEEKEVVNVIERVNETKTFTIWKEEEEHVRKGYKNCGVISKEEKYWNYTPKSRRRKLSNGYYIYLMRIPEYEEREIIKDTIHMK